jgi:uncharacterized protein YyaL (SSP411 family)
MMISAFAKGSRVSNNKSFFLAAENGISFIENNLIIDGKLLRTYKNGTAKIQAYLEDYSYLINALLDVFEINPKLQYLENAKNFATYLIDHFWDSKNNSFFMTGDTHEKLIIRPKSNYDLSIPSGNSLAAYSFLRLFHLTQEKKFFDIALKIMESQAAMASENPFGFGHLLNTIFMYLQKPSEITILNPKNVEIYKFLMSTFLPESILVTISDEIQLKSLSDLPFFAGKEFKEEKTTVFICKDFTCSLPLESILEIEKHLK